MGLLFAVLFGVALARAGRVLGSMVLVSGSGMGMMGSLLMVASFVALGRLGVVLGGFRMVFGGLLVAVCCFLRHGGGELKGEKCWASTGHVNSQLHECLVWRSAGRVELLAGPGPPPGQYLRFMPAPTPLDHARDFLRHQVAAAHGAGHATFGNAISTICQRTGACRPNQAG